MWTYFQSTGLLKDGRGANVCVGYSGHEDGFNNPKLEAEPDVGPIPVGKWLIGKPQDHPHLGPLVMHLTPFQFDPHGRSGFFIHGDNKLANGSASHGCIILPRWARQAIASSLAVQLEVTA